MVLEDFCLNLDTAGLNGDSASSSADVAVMILAASGQVYACVNDGSPSAKSRVGADQHHHQHHQHQHQHDVPHVDGRAERTGAIGTLSHRRRQGGGACARNAFTCTARAGSPRSV
eukprot:2959679-Pleurochrysis_carterae.AAC.3